MLMVQYVLRLSQTFDLENLALEWVNVTIKSGLTAGNILR